MKVDRRVWRALGFSCIHFGLLVGVPVVVLTAVTHHPMAIDYTIGAMLLGAGVGFTVWLFGTAFDLAVLGLKSLLLDVWRLAVAIARRIKTKGLEQRRGIFRR
jgi:ABC-type antimicrobial peptide transport system permease subunit